MIRRPKQPTEAQRIAADLKATRAEIARYEAPSEAGPRHEAHVRERWNAHIETLRAHEAALLAQRKALR